MSLGRADQTEKCPFHLKFKEYVVRIFYYPFLSYATTINFNFQCAQ